MLYSTKAPPPRRSRSPQLWVPAVCYRIDDCIIGTLRKGRQADVWFIANMGLASPLHKISNQQRATR